MLIGGQILSGSYSSLIAKLKQQRTPNMFWLVYSIWGKRKLFNDAIFLIKGQNMAAERKYH